MRGSLIVLEGLDHAGKSTQADLLVDALIQRGCQVQLWRFPAVDTLIGRMIEDYLAKNIELDDRAIHLLFSANRWELASQMKHTLEMGVHIIVDRYVYSGVAYTAAKQLIAPPASIATKILRWLGFSDSLDWFKSCDAGLLKPDLVIFLDNVDCNWACEYKDRYEECAKFQETVLKSYKKVFEGERVFWIKSTNNDLHKILLSQTLQTISRQTNQFRYLWS